MTAIQRLSMDISGSKNLNFGFATVHYVNLCRCEPPLLSFGGEAISFCCEIFHKIGDCFGLTPSQRHLYGREIWVIPLMIPGLKSCRCRGPCSASQTNSLYTKGKKMKTKKTACFITGCALILSALACNLAPSPAPQEASATIAPVAASTEETPPTGGPSESHSPCENPYLPVVTGAAWNYQLTGPIPDTFTRSIIGVEGDKFTDQDTFGTGVTRQSNWVCDNGNLTALNPAGGGSSAVDVDNYSADFQATQSSGVTIPLTIAPGDAWTQTITLEGKHTISGTEIPTKTDFSNSCKAVGIESVTVPAGVFDAVRIECETVMNITITMNDSPIQQNITILGANWYAENVGLVKTFSATNGVESTIELTSYNIP
jgi:hypothetical protein